MTVPSATSSVIFTGNDDTAFAFTFPIFDTSDIEVKTEVIATGVQDTLTETTDYTVDEPTPGSGFGSGGTVNLTEGSFPDGLADTYKIIIKRVIPITQEIDPVENDPNRAEVFEEALDRQVMIAQQLQEQVSRSVKVSETQSSPDELLESIETAVEDAETAQTAAEAAQGLAETAQTAAEDAQTAAEAAAASIPDDVVIGDGSVNPTNLLSNGDFEGTEASVVGWSVTGSGSSQAQETTIVKCGTSSRKLTRAGIDCYFSQDIYVKKGIAYWQGRTITFGCWVYATVADRARIFINNAPGANAYSSYHTGDSTWQFLTVTLTVAANATQVICGCIIETGNTDAYFDGAMCVEGSSAFAFSPKPVAEGFGSWVDKSASYAAQQATTDGFVHAYITNAQLDGYTDAAADPTTIRAKCDYTGVTSMMFAVRKGDYWKVVKTGVGSSMGVYWIPLGT